jgi:hypothetical protein
MALSLFLVPLCCGSVCVVLQPDTVRCIAGKFGNSRKVRAGRQRYDTPYTIVLLALRAVEVARPGRWGCARASKCVDAAWPTATLIAIAVTSVACLTSVHIMVAAQQPLPACDPVAKQPRWRRSKF